MIILSGAPLTQEQWEKCKDREGRIADPEAIKEIIFRGVNIFPLIILVLNIE